LRLEKGSVSTPTVDLTYLVYSPDEVGAGIRLPLIVFLHGRGERGTDVEMVKRHGLPAFIEAGNELPAVVVAPQCAPGKHWGHMFDGLEAMLASLLRSQPVSPDRVVLTGFSMGGFGAWYWARRSPRHFTGIAPVAGSGSPWGDERRIVDPCELRALPIWVIHGSADEIVDVEGADEAAARLSRCHGDFRYTRYEGVGHMESCRRAFEDPELHAWLLARERTPGAAR
jgi:predicted peptidase